MRRANRRRAITIAIFITVILAQFAWFSSVRDVVRQTAAAPIIALDTLGRKIGTFFSLLGSIDSLSAENARVNEENIRLSAEVARLKTLEAENEQLKKDLQFAQVRPDLRLIPVAIINYSPSGSFQAITVNKGQRDGIKLEQAVVSNGYLVGKIKKVSEQTSEVWLLSNRNLLTPVLLTQANTSGILKGGIRGLVVDTIPIDANVKVGETVVTSALEELYPAGIAVGRVEEIISLKEEIFVEARISSPINIRNLQTLFVVAQ